MANSIAKRALGSSGIMSSAIGLGCMSLSGIYGKSGDDEGIAMIHEALDLALPCSTPPTPMAPAITKNWSARRSSGRRSGSGPGDQIRQSRRARRQIRRRPAGIRHEFLRGEPQAAGVDVIDLYYQHRIDPTVPIEDTVGAMAKLVEEGKVRALGLSEAQPEDRPPRPRRPSDRRRAERILAAVPRRGRGDAADDARSSTSPSSPIRRSAAAS